MNFRNLAAAFICGTLRMGVGAREFHGWSDRLGFEETPREMGASASGFHSWLGMYAS